MFNLRAFVFLIGMSAFTEAYGQTAEGLVKAEDVGATPGVPAPSGLGYFANADNYHGLSIGVQAGLGVSANSATFGYDNLAVSARWHPGDNAFGRCVSLLAGFSDWRVPAYRLVFPDSVIDPLPKQERFAAQSANATTIGVSFAFGRNSDLNIVFNEAQNNEIEELNVLIGSTEFPAPNPARFEELKKKKNKNAAELKELTKLRLVQGHQQGEAISAAQKAEWTTSIALVHTQAVRVKQRELALTTGGLLRITSFAEETDAQAYDLFATVAKGTAAIDFVLAGHYLGYLDKSLPKHAFTVAGGVFANTDVAGSKQMGLTAGYGYYAFEELYKVIPEARKLDKGPATQRLDVLLSFSGAPDKANQTGAGLGIRYSYINPSLRDSYHAVSVVFSTNFSLIK